MAITKIQDNAYAVNGGSNILSRTTTTHYTSATTAGNLLICILTCYSIDSTPETPPTPTLQAPATTGFTWTLLADVLSPLDASQGWIQRTAIYYIANAASMGTGVNTVGTVTVPTTEPGETINIDISLYELGGFLTATPFDHYVTNTGISNVPSAGNITTTSSGLIIVAASFPKGNLVAGSGFTIVSANTSQGVSEYILNAAVGTYTAAFGTLGGGVRPWSAIAAAFSEVGAVNGTAVVSGTDTQTTIAFSNPIAIGTSGDGGGGGSSDGGVTGCGDCQGPHLLQLIPGFSDLPNSVLSADDPAFALHLGEIAMNATFGMVRLEVFPCLQKHGDTVPLPRSCWDGYKYSREELNYFWTVQNSTDPSTRWISGPDSLWFSNWNVNQSTGEVFSEEWYERSSAADTRLAAKSNDGSLMIFCVGQRQKTNMIIVSPPSYTSISESTIATDKPYTQDLIQHLNDNAKFSCINTEFFYLGEYVDGNTVQLPASPVDGYEYSAAECQFLHAWRWTADGGDYVQPPGDYEQAAPFQASIDPSGLVSITVTFSTSGGEGVLTAPAYGRIAAFAFCRRSATPASSPLADDFTELDLGFFFPGRTVRASELLTIKHNIDEAILSPEFFGPTEYRDEDVVPLPVSTVDGYAYSREEVQYIWSWSDTTNNAGGSHVRLPLFFGSVDPESGTVKLRTWRLPPGGPFVDDENGNAIIRVIVMATRQAIHPLLTLGVINDDLLVTPADSGTLITDDSGDLINGT